MNEQIKELAEQAGLYVDLEGSPWPRAMSAEECEAAYKKFAELIIRKCTNMLPSDSIRDENGVHMFYVIREHFGVKERKDEWGHQE
jgi:hypothetical protein